MIDILAVARRVFAVESRSVADLSNFLTEEFEKAVLAILHCKGRIVVCGMGKSGLIGKKIVATLASTGTPSFFMHPAEAFHGDLGMITPEDIFIGISNSGETEELIRILPAIQRSKNIFIAISGKKDSTLVKNADFFLNTFVEEEACPLQLAPTSSTTAALAMGDALAVALMELRDFKEENFALFHPGGSLGKKLLTKVQDVMRTEHLPFVSPETSMKELIFKVTEARLGLAIVLKDNKLAGVVTDGDIRRAWNDYDTFLQKTVADLMCGTPKTISPNTSLADAEQILINFRISTLVVVDHEQKVLGTVQVYNIK
ncbi:MAG: KpsF/GutQ family sugar-phosphate isomerase [Bacteroidetes bacterium]|nr:MAG: KpsF/GutQ family sugar-phosphate isomerase [Bacteroidota bacterium]